MWGTKTNPPHIFFFRNFTSLFILIFIFVKFLGFFLNSSKLNSTSVQTCSYHQETHCRLFFCVCIIAKISGISSRMYTHMRARVIGRPKFLSGCSSQLECLFRTQHLTQTSAEYCTCVYVCARVCMSVCVFFFHM